MDMDAEPIGNLTPLLKILRNKPSLIEVGGENGEGDCKGGAYADFGFHFDMPLVLLNNRVDDGEAKT